MLDLLGSFLAFLYLVRISCNTGKLLQGMRLQEEQDGKNI